MSTTLDAVKKVFCIRVVQIGPNYLKQVIIDMGGVGEFTRRIANENSAMWRWSMPRGMDSQGHTISDYQEAWVSRPCATTSRSPCAYSR
jgi:hypothetical protein